MLSTVSAVAAQNIGAGKHERARRALGYGIAVCVGVGAVVFVTCQFAADQIVGIFVTGEPEVVRLGGQYLRSYSLDCIIAGIQFCFSGFFSACGRSLYSFIHNITSIVLVRIPGAYLASVMFPATLYPMGLAAPMGSLLSSVICFFLYKKLVRDIEDPAETDIITENSANSTEGR
jgi:Na+-driven multidrug efflux pump